MVNNHLENNEWNKALKCCAITESEVDRALQRVGTTVLPKGMTKYSNRHR
jgi:hypothetical protein